MSQFIYSLSLSSMIVCTLLGCGQQSQSFTYRESSDHTPVKFHFSSQQTFSGDHTRSKFQFSAQQTPSGAWSSNDAEMSKAAEFENEARIQIMLKNYRDALESLNQALEIHVGRLPCLGLKANVLLALDRNAEALSVAEQLILIKPTTIVGHVHKATALGNLGRHKEALPSYDRAIMLTPRAAVIWCNKGNSLSALGKYKEALECYEESTKLKPKYASPWREKALCLFKPTFPIWSVLSALHPC